MESAIAATLSDRFGEALRSVAHYDDDGTELEYVRDDVEADYQKGDIDSVFRNAKLEALDQHHQESLYTHGNLQCTLRCFEDATELHFVQHESRGIVAAVDTGALSDLRGLIDDCLDAIDAD